jgi:pseudo-rSAM protein
MAKRDQTAAAEYYWLTIYPFIYAITKANDAMLYNTISGKSLIYKNNPSISELIKRLIKQKNMYVTKIRLSDDNRDFVNDIREGFYGDIIRNEDDEYKPIQLRPNFIPQKPIADLTSLVNPKYVLRDDKIVDYLDTIDIYINGACDQNCSVCKVAFKQQSFCRKKYSNIEITIPSLNKILAQIRHTRVSLIRILGGNIFMHSKISDILAILSDAPQPKCYFIHSSLFRYHIDKMTYFERSGTRIDLLVTRPYNGSIISVCLDTIREKGIEHVCTFAIEDEIDIITAKKMVSKLRINQYRLVPIYNGNNLAFFKNNVFIDEKSLFSKAQNMQSIFAKETINPSEIGKIVVDNKLDIRANINNPPLGNLSKMSLFDAVNKELNEGRSFRKVRKKVYPCRACLYNSLCPPFSNYEYVFHRSDLCKIGPTSKGRGLSFLKINQ